MRLLAALMAAMGLAGCASDSVRSIPSSGSLIPDYTLKVSPSISIALEKIVIWGTLAGAAYLVLDPLAPNWDIEETPLSADHIHFSLKMKRYSAGGAGEAQAVFNRRAKELMRLNNFEDYKVLEYQEGLDSSVLGSQRTAVGVVQLTNRKASG
jgi:hypothetical protein